MADALCGPSNALQNFQKHSTVDRTLQQDRLTSRQSPSQGFRSSSGPNTGVLDAEFNAFEAGHTGAPQLHQRFHPPPPALGPQFAQHTHAPNWASDFQRLSLAPSYPQPLQQHHPAQAPSAAASWHQDFINQQASTVQASPQQHAGFGGHTGRSMTWGPTTFQGSLGAPVSNVAQGKQRAREDVEVFDEAAFAQAFEQAQQDQLHTDFEQLVSKIDDPTVRDKLRLYPEQQRMELMESYNSVQASQEEKNLSRILEQTERTRILDSMPIEDDPVLLHIKETRPMVYAAIKLKNDIDLGNYSDALPWIEQLKGLDNIQSGDVSEERWCADALQNVVERHVSSEITSAAESTIMSINERIMSQQSLLSAGVPVSQDRIWEELAAAGYTTRTPLQEQRTDQRSEQKKEEQPLRNDDDEMAETAGKLLERVADNTSEKFQNSQFLELMRRLRDREVRVEGDKMVDVSSEQTLSSPLPATATAPPEIDPMILDYSAQDFGMPVDSGMEEVGLSRHSTNEPITDEISDQFSYYNVNAPYHK
ncbi:hypothetical protein K491DRAFT_694313 [Lophiostoma macrostomum CBS 122681]|uniref:Uncharacterized protein n=1 Tax=Lophiostoma macrostomum CBS 122681 TaxID=1314788 RepID=A0A6A6T506_9PLEO|nr:hypothetical protein K491DRAFT_694313 [Lophiostoma macrostomum CBS 122681]